jgi:hypothetical protein
MAKKQLPTFKVGDRVTWTSQANGGERTKTGEVTDVIKPGYRPGDKVAGCGGQRDHESYVVRVHSRLFWPRVSKLEKA